MATVERVAIATQFVSAKDGIDCSIFFRPSHFKDCVAIAMCLIVALFFPFLIEVCWLLYCVVYSLCKITQLEKQDNRKCIFATDGILEQNSVRRTFKCVATVTCLIMAAPHLCFCGVQWLFIHVIYIKCLGFWLERKDSWKKKFRPSQWWPILDLALRNKDHVNAYTPYFIRLTRILHCDLPEYDQIKAQCDNYNGKFAVRRNIGSYNRFDHNPDITTLAQDKTNLEIPLAQ